jgi:hypothetical protein
MSAYDTAREIFRRSFPSLVFRPQSVGDWNGEFPLPEAVVEYFAEFGPVNVWIPGYGNPYFLPALSKLRAHQTGYRTHGITYERIDDWDDDWLVIADQGGDPFIFSRSGGGFLHAVHGEGVWEPIRMWDSLVEMATTLAIIGEIVNTSGQELTDADSLIFPRYRQAARQRIGEVLNSEGGADVLLERLGWGKIST